MQMRKVRAASPIGVLALMSTVGVTACGTDAGEMSRAEGAEAGDAAAASEPTADMAEPRVTIIDRKSVV